MKKDFQCEACACTFIDYPSNERRFCTVPCYEKWKAAQLSTEDRFWGKVEKSPTCWLWRAGKRRRGYGHFWVKGRGIIASRFSWELANGPIPHDLNVLHACDNPPCVRPDHLFLGTKKENYDDSFNKGRSTQPRIGKANPISRLLESEIKEIRKRYESGETQPKLGQEFGVTRSAIGKVVRRETWRHV